MDFNFKKIKVIYLTQLQNLTDDEFCLLCYILTEIPKKVKFELDSTSLLSYNQNLMKFKLKKAAESLKDDEETLNVYNSLLKKMNV